MIARNVKIINENTNVNNGQPIKTNAAKWKGIGAARCGSSSGGGDQAR
jgi:hypothetical protein